MCFVRTWLRCFAGAVKDSVATPSVQQQEEGRLRAWVQQLRHERRRLEDKLLMGDPQARGFSSLNASSTSRVVGNL